MKNDILQTRDGNIYIFEVLKPNMVFSSGTNWRLIIITYVNRRI